MGVAAIRIVIVDDWMLFRKGIAALLKEIGDFEVVGETARGQNAVRLVQQLNPDVTLMALTVPGISAIDTLGHLITVQPDARVLVLAGCTAEEDLLSVVRAGAAGCLLLKDCTPSELASAIRTVHRGEPWLAPAISRRLLRDLRHQGPNGSQPIESEHLTRRESAVLRLLAQGLGNRAIARRLEVSDATIRTHVSHILGKLHLENRVQAALFALQKGTSSRSH